ncbi:hypothetical protein KUDE01_003996 [Dissostichus eleginoides]|uniref:DUF4550 domain-containing protein n=1 Tax=Dissostichus eleginoides TaxID=100907 RepID=A0AAD9FGL7_DISEL|nr:hypothetical protein KUDE01_003996 [Dissostichus eleginoides]
MSNTTETALCEPQSVCEDGDVKDEGQEDLLVLETDMLSMEHGLEHLSGSTEDITTCKDGNSNYITWTVDIVLAVPKEEDVDVPEALEKTKKKTKDSSTVSVKGFKAQSCYHVEYKLLPGDTETVKVDLVVFGQVAKMYKEDEFKNFEVRVARETLISLLPHKIQLQIWNSKDKLCSLARYERLKAFRWTQDQPDDAPEMCGGGIKALVNKLRSSCESNTCKKHRGDKLLNSEVGKETDFQKPTVDAFDLEEMKKNGTALMEIRLVRLLAGETSLTERFPVRSAGVFEVMCNVSLERELMSEELKAELNPLVITILSATSMPSSPVPFHILQEKCVPVYCQYKFHKVNMYRTKNHEHGTKIFFRDVNVILTGLMSPEELKEFLSGPPLEIEVHDRDRKLEETPRTPAMLRARSDDDIRKAKKAAIMNSYGIANLNFSELLLGKKSLKMQLQVKSCPPGNRKTLNTADQQQPMPQGHYLEANSLLKVEVEIACPLNVKNGSFEPQSCDGHPFGRIVYLFDYNNFSLMTKLRSEILRINASAFHLGSRSLETAQQALSNYIMNFKNDESEDLDVVTGFHVSDQRAQIFVLEGLKHKAVKRLWEAVPMKLSGSEEDQVIVLYNSNLGFFKRIYDSLDVGLSPISLCKSLESIMRQPMIYIRGMLPQPCFQALLRLKQLCEVRQLKDAVQWNLFPSADMILGMIKEYGTYPEYWEQKVETNHEVDMTSLPVIRIKRHAPLNTCNKEFMRWKHDRQQSKDFIQDNIKKVKEESERLQKQEAAVIKMDQSAERPTHNYSIQTYNSTELEKELLRKEMAMVPGCRFTYSQQYQSATVEQGDVTLKKDSNSTAADTLWLKSLSSDKSTRHPKHPDEARVEELRKPWRENILHADLLKQTLSRDVWGWSRRCEDFHLLSKPPPVFSPTSINLAGEPLHQEQLEAARTQYCRWMKKLLPEGRSYPACNSHIPEFKCLMGGNSERIQEILKDEPNKYSLRKEGMALKPFPELSVMNLDDSKDERKRRGALAPGPCVDCSLSSKDNAIERHTSLYNKYHYMGFKKQHSFLYKRTALPLTDKEKSIFTFQKYAPNMKTQTSSEQH